MKSALVNLLVVVTLAGCANLNQPSGTEGFCIGLGPSVDDFAEVLLEEQEKTPDEVITKGTKVVVGFDSIC